MVPPQQPKRPYTIPGGCNCKAIRYRVLVPEFEKRAPTPYRTPGADIGDLRIPMSVICHCNDCRAATSAIPSLAVVTEIETVEVSLVRRDTTSISEGPLPIDQEREYVPASGVFDSKNPGLGQTFLSVYKSSPQRNRWFCSRCGTPIAYSIDAGVVPPEWGWPPMLDIWAGTVDTLTLQEPWMAPERMLWCEKGIDWVREYATRGAGGVPEHPLTKIDVVIQGR